MSQTIKSKGFTLIELLVVVGIIGALIGILVPVLAIARKRSNMMIEGTNVSSATKSLAVYADGNKTFYPGLSNTGKFSTINAAGAGFNGQKYAAYANGSSFAGGYGNQACNSLAYALLLDEDSMAPKQMISTGETGGNSTATALNIVEATPEASTSKASTTDSSTGLVDAQLNSSYAILAYTITDLRAEWKGTTSQQAPVIATRLIFSDGATTNGADTYNSVWTEALSGSWEGSVVRNDTSVGREKFKSNAEILDQLKNLKFGAKVCPTGSISSATACGLWGNATNESGAGNATIAANFGTFTVTDGTGADGFLGASND